MNERGSMVNQIVEQMRDAARLMLSPGCLIDKFLDWIEELSGVLAAAQGDEPVSREGRTEALVDAVSA